MVHRRGKQGIKTGARGKRSGRRQVRAKFADDVAASLAAANEGRVLESGAPGDREPVVGDYEQSDFRKQSYIDRGRLFRFARVAGLLDVLAIE